MSDDISTVTVPAGPLTREERERQLLEAVQNDPLQVYAAYLRIFGTGDVDAPTLTPRAMVACIVEHEYPADGKT